MTKTRMQFLLISDPHGKLGVVNELVEGRDKEGDVTAMQKGFRSNLE